MSHNDHHKEVHEFFKKAKQENPERFADVCRRNPTISARQWKRIHQREGQGGLIGLQPTPIDPSVAFDAGVESAYSGEEG